MRFSIKYKPPRAPGALKTASSCLTLYIGCYRTSLEKNFSSDEKPQNQLVDQCHLSIGKCHFCHSISFLSIGNSRATASSFALQCPLDGSSNLARGYIYVLFLKNTSGRPAPRVGRRHYCGKNIFTIVPI